MDKPGQEIDPAIAELGSTDPQVANAAVKKILQMREKAFPLLLTAKGMDQPFYGTTLMNPKSSILIPVPMKGFEIPPEQKYKVVTLEVAALYLICAIYHDNLHFARAPQLVNIDVARSERTVGNTPERMKSAFQSMQAWVEKAKRLRTLKEIQEKMPPPLKDVNLGWN